MRNENIVQQSDYTKYWGKARPNEGAAVNYHLLPFHSCDVAAVGSALWERKPRLQYMFASLLGCTKEEARRFVLFLMMIHDIGKLSTAFQMLNPEAYESLNKLKAKKQTSGHRHDSLGYILLWKHFISAWEFDQVIGLTFEHHNNLYLILGCVTGHHGKPPQKIRWSEGKAYFKAQDIEVAKQFIEAAINLLNPPPIHLTEHTSPILSVILSGFTTQCDWMGSNQNYFPYCAEAMDLNDYWDLALKRAEKMVTHIGFEQIVIAHQKGLNHLFPSISKPRPMQVIAETISIAPKPQLFILEDMTGSGKTEAALLITYRLMQAGQADGFYFALPTMATADQMYDRTQECYQRFFSTMASLILAHGSRQLSERFLATLGFEAPPEEALIPNEHETASAFCHHWLADNLKKSLLGHVGVGTVDQVMLATMCAKHHTLRLFGLIGKVLIIDEVHAYDPYMVEILNKLIENHTRLGGSTILLSATLPSSMKSAYIDAYQKGLQTHSSIESMANPAYPLLTHISENKIQAHTIQVPEYAHRKIKVEILHDAIEEKLISLAKRGVCVCWIRNSVDDAYEAHKSLKSKGIQATLFHARFALIDRLHIQEEVLARFGKHSGEKERRGQIVIATQVIEQSLDVDFDYVISDLAPMDLLIQRLGRQMRHSRDLQGNRIKDKDERGPIRFMVHCPVFDPSPDMDWLSKALPRTAKVYQHASFILWRTQQILTERGEVILPKDARCLIEDTYNSEYIPESLLAEADAGFLQKIASENAAARKLLDMDIGYKTPDLLPEDQMQTRTGLPTRELYLACFDGSQVTPYAESAKQPWPMSRISIPSYLLDEIHNPEQAQSLIDAWDEEHKRLKSKILVIQPSDGDQWTAQIISNEQHKTITYSRKTGIHFPTKPNTRTEL